MLSELAVLMYIKTVGFIAGIKKPRECRALAWLFSLFSIMAVIVACLMVLVASLRICAA
jgi:hypothetical protein